MTSLTIAMSIDYSLFLLSRYSDEIGRGRPLFAAVDTMLRFAGHTILVSGGTLVCCFLGMLFFPMAMLQAVGIGASVALLVALLVNLTLTPALLFAFGRVFARCHDGRCCARKDGAEGAQRVVSGAAPPGYGPLGDAGADAGDGGDIPHASIGASSSRERRARALATPPAPRARFLPLIAVCFLFGVARASALARPRDVCVLKAPTKATKRARESLVGWRGGASAPPRRVARAPRIASSPLAFRTSSLIALARRPARFSRRRARPRDQRRAARALGRGRRRVRARLERGARRRRRGRRERRRRGVGRRDGRERVVPPRLAAAAAARRDRGAVRGRGELPVRVHVRDALGGERRLRPDGAEQRGRVPRVRRHARRVRRGRGLPVHAARRGRRRRGRRRRDRGRVVRGGLRRRGRRARARARRVGLGRQRRERRGPRHGRERHGPPRRRRARAHVLPASRLRGARVRRRRRRARLHGRRALARVPAREHGLERRPRAHGDAHARRRPVLARRRGVVPRGRARVPPRAREQRRVARAPRARREQLDRREGRGLREVPARRRRHARDRVRADGAELPQPRRAAALGRDARAHVELRLRPVRAHVPARRGRG